jgi:hypothetical protein
MINDNLSIVYKLQQRLSRQSRYGPTAEVMAAFLPNVSPVYPMIDALLGGRDGVVGIIFGIDLTIVGRKHTHEIFFVREAGTYGVYLKDDEQSLGSSNKWELSYLDVPYVHSTTFFQSKSSQSTSSLVPIGQNLDAYIKNDFNLSGFYPNRGKPIKTSNLLAILGLQFDIDLHVRNNLNETIYKTDGAPVIACAKTHDGKTFEPLKDKKVLCTLRDIGGYELPPLLQVYVGEPLDEEKARVAMSSYNDMGLPGWATVLEEALKNQGR